MSSFKDFYDNESLQKIIYEMYKNSNFANFLHYLVYIQEDIEKIFKLDIGQIDGLSLEEFIKFCQENGIEIEKIFFDNEKKYDNPIKTLKVEPLGPGYLNNTKSSLAKKRQFGGCEDFECLFKLIEFLWDPKPKSIHTYCFYEQT
jgi:hypothetical protein